MLFTPDPRQKVRIALDMLFPQQWLAERAKSDPFAGMNGNTKENEMGKTNYQIQKEVCLSLSPTRKAKKRKSNSPTRYRRSSSGSP
jgi:hypothetical protein